MIDYLHILLLLFFAVVQTCQKFNHLLHHSEQKYHTTLMGLLVGYNQSYKYLPLHHYLPNESTTVAFAEAAPPAMRPLRHSGA